MKGAINYLRRVREICQEHKGDCKNCPLGNKQNVDDCICPRLSNPANWNNDKIVDMVNV